MIHNSLSVKSSIALIVRVLDCLWERTSIAQGRQILAQNLIYFMNFVDLYYWQGVA